MRRSLKRVRKQVRKYLRKWEWMVTKWGWQFDVYFYERWEDLSKADKKAHGPEAAAFVWGDFSYLKGSLHVVLERFEFCQEQIEGMVVHELTHFLLFPLQEDGLVEYATETVSRVLLMVDGR